MEGLTMEHTPFHDKSCLSPPASKSPIHSEEDESKFSCPSPLITEPPVDDDPYEAPSSIEAEANSSDGGFDDLDITDQQDLSNTAENGDDNQCGDDDPESNLGLLDLFEPIPVQGCCNNPELEDNIKSDTAVAGLCGFANFANTCYMNSGLQCLLATPTVVKFFTECYKSKKVNKLRDESPKNNDGYTGLTDHFGPLLQNVWGGEYRQLKPVDFKDTLSESYPQFRGTQQHDCQEFLALLLDTLHEELKAESNDQSECGTSMELHTPHSTEKSAQLSVDWISRHSSFDNGSTDPLANSKTIQSDPIPDENESRGSPAGSPKSFDSHSSMEDKVAMAIRHCPIPKAVKSGKFAEEDAVDDDDTMDSVAGGRASGTSTAQPTSNLISPDNLKRGSVVRFSEDGVLNKTSINNVVKGSKTNNERASPTPSPAVLPSTAASASLTINDYLKESKTLNVNVLVDDDDEMNNEISFDSEKFSRHDKVRLREAIDNLNSANPEDDLDVDKTSTTTTSQPKRLKTTNMPTSETTNGGETVYSGGVSSSDDGSHTWSVESSCDFNGIKRIRLDSSDKEKNVQFERERLQQEVTGVVEVCESEDSVAGMTIDDPARLKEAIEADRYWEKYLACNDTIVARTFQGQFKNTVVCTVCNFVSVSFEPFMYLPVPLPNAHILQLKVTFVSSRAYTAPVMLLLNMTPADNVGSAKEQVVQLLGHSLTSLSKLTLVEVFDHHVSRVVDDWVMCTHLKDDRKVYVVEVLGTKDEEGSHCDSEDPVVTSSSEPAMDQSNSGSGGDVSCGGDTEVVSSSEPSSAAATCAPNPNPEPVSDYQACVICMEDFSPRNLRQHNACDCVMCAPCLDRTIEHHQGEVDFDDPSTAFADGQIKCPGCRQDADPTTEFITLDMVGKSKPRVRTFTLTVVNRLDKTDDTSQSKNLITIFGHPTLVKVTNCITGATLHQILEPVNPLKGNIFEYVLVSANGKSCSRCIFSSNCRGCIKLSPTDDAKEVLLQPSDTIAVSFTGSFLNQSDLDRASQTENHPSMDQPLMKDQLDLDDCLAAFSEKEMLDESNPWYCPVCRKHQCATKTLSIWRFPDFLIIYLKRFVYVNNVTGSVKLDKFVNFKVNNLDLTPFLSGPLQADSRPVFNMYGCVCHFGSVGGGHYTAYSRHLAIGSWNYFDDDSINEGKVPGEASGDNSSAYILFYQRAGSRCDSQLPAIARQCRAFALGEANRVENGAIEPKSSPPDSVASEAMQAEDGVNNTLEDEEDEERPDLMQIIRSLDTPPPS